MSRSVLTAIFLLISVPALFAGTEKKVPALPQSVLEAKTMYVDNESGDAKLYNKALAELNAWGRFSLVPNQATADVTLVISTQVTGKNDEGEKYGSLTLQIMKPHDDIPQFSATQEDTLKYMERDVVKNLKILRKRLEESQKSPTPAATEAK